MEQWKKDYNRYMFKSNTSIAEGIDNPNIVHRCPYCSEYLWADKNHMSYRYCVYCGRSLKGKKLPFERI